MMLGTKIFEFEPFLADYGCFSKKKLIKSSKYTVNAPKGPFFQQNGHKSAKKGPNSKILVPNIINFLLSIYLEHLFGPKSQQN